MQVLFRLIRVSSPCLLRQREISRFRMPPVTRPEITVASLHLIFQLESTSSLFANNQDKGSGNVSMWPRQIRMRRETKRNPPSLCINPIVLNTNFKRRDLRALYYGR